MGKLDSIMQKNETGLLSNTKINSKWMKDINVRQETITILEENTSSNLIVAGYSNFSPDMSPEARKTQA